MGLGENGGVGGRGDGGRGPRIFSEENLCPELLQAVEGVKYIADVTRKEEESNKVNYRQLSTVIKMKKYIKTSYFRPKGPKALAYKFCDFYL